MQELELIHFPANRRAAMMALTDCGVPMWDRSDETANAPEAFETRSPRASGPDDGPGNERFDLDPAPKRRAHQAWSTLRIAVIVGDLFILLGTPLLCHLLYLSDWVRDTPGLVFVESNCFLTLCGLHLARAYSRTAMMRSSQALHAVFLAQAGAVVAIMSFGFLSREFADLSRLWLMSSWVTSASLLLTFHLAVTVLVARIMKAGHLRERVAIVCTGPEARNALEKFRAAATPEVLIVGIFDDRKDRLPEDFNGYRIEGDTDNLLSYIRRNGIDRVIVTIPWTAEERIIKLVTKLRQTPVRVDLIAHKLISDSPTDVHRIHGVPIVTVANHRVDAQMDWLKRAEDLVLGTLILVLAAPVMLAVAIAIRLDSPGPILFRQNRSGFNNEVVEVFKFRSMYANRPLDPEARQATKGDPRVTRVGRFIRRTSLDELPQLLNVLTGEMSLVGPRPHAVPHNNYFGRQVDGYFARHNVKPGITGWAQINGYRGETDTLEKMSNRVRYDLEYIDRWSLLFDLKILFLTAFRVWLQESAY